MRESDSQQDEQQDSFVDSTFSCPACGQEISVNSEMKAAILSNGCPVCANSVEESDFE
jgi:transcription elongation factor Elf1